ncbi:DUF6786 family protein [Bacteroidota bacterium]
MRKRIKTIILLSGFLSMLVFLILSCNSGNKEKTKMEMNEYQKGTFGYALKILKNADNNLVVLKDKSGESQIIVSAHFQGKVFTSSAEGLTGNSFGWVNFELIKSGDRLEHMNGYGSEDRLWIGPEGGQFSVFFKPGGAMDFSNWFTPAPFDYEPWELISKTDTKVEIKKDMILKNYSGTEFNIRVNRNVSLLSKFGIQNLLNIEIPVNVKQVGFESENIITNTGDNSWTKKSGTISIWMLSMFNTSPGATVVIPYHEGDEKELGKIATTNYFGEISDERLLIKDGAIYFKVDGKKRRKLGLAPGRVKPVSGSYDETNGVLTIVQYSVPEDNNEYVNQLWPWQDKPFIGDVMNSYNDGPLEDGTQMGPFYEIESSSPAAFLAPEENLVHYHRVIHFVGGKKELNKISVKVLGVTIEQIIKAF